MTSFDSIPWERRLAVDSLPREVCVLDLELAAGDVRSPEEATPCVVGTRRYSLTKGEYSQGIYQPYTLTELPQLEADLHRHRGLIVGHNIFGFDYRVLRTRIDLRGIVDKSVDTLFFLWHATGRELAGLALEKLAQANLSTGKTMKGREVQAAWQGGRHDEVIAYNDMDCQLTFDLWWHLVSEGRIFIPRGYRSESLVLATRNLRELTGSRLPFTFHTWERKLQTDGFIIDPPVRRRRIDEDEVDIEDETETQYAWFSCEACQQTTLFRATILRGFADHQAVYCPTCRQPLGTIRADMGSAVVGTVEGVIDSGVAQGLFPEEFRSIINQQWEPELAVWQPPPDRDLDTCGTCGCTAVTTTDEFYENPADSMPVCVACLTSGRWQLALS